MSFYDLSETDRILKKDEIAEAILCSVTQNDFDIALPYFADEDTYIRKAAYQAVGKLYVKQADIREAILSWLSSLYQYAHENVRQTVIYAAGEIAAKHFEDAAALLEKGLIDPHHSVRNAVTGGLKNAGSKNPSTLAFFEKHIKSSDPEIRRLVLHGLELRGRTHPQEIIGLLRELQFEKNKRVRDMLIHVLGQISYKKGCFSFVVKQLEGWENKDVFTAFAKEAIEVHGRYEKFSELTQMQVESFFVAKGIEL